MRHALTALAALLAALATGCSSTSIDMTGTSNCTVKVIATYKGQVADTGRDSLLEGGAKNEPGGGASGNKGELSLPLAP